MKQAIYLIMALLLLATAFAEADTVFDKSIPHNTVVSLNGTDYTIRIGTANNTPIRVESDFESVQLNEGECITRRYDEFCYLSWDEEQKVNARHIDSRPVLEIDRDVSLRSLDLGEISIITLTIENTGGEAVNDFFFSETIPRGLTLVNATGCSISEDDDQTIEWDEDIFPDTVERCAYRIQATREGVYTYEGSYTTNLLMSSLDADAVPQVSITNSNSFNFNMSVSKSVLDVGQPFVFTVSLENLESENGDNLTVHNITVYFNDEVEVIQEYNSPFTTTLTPDRFKFSGKVRPQELLEQRLELQPIVAEENITLVVDVVYQFDGESEVSFTDRFIIEQEILPLECEYIVVDDAGNNLISLVKLNNTLPGFDRGELFVYVYNRNAYADIEDIRFVTSGDINFPSVARNREIRRNEDEILTSKEFTFDALSQLNLKSQTTIDYEILGSFFEATCSGNVLVEEPRFFTLDKSLSFENITLADGTIRTVPRVLVEVENVFFLPLRDIQITEALPSQIFTNNNTQKTFDLATLEIYNFEYDFVIPSDFATLEDDTLTLDSTISYKVYDSEFTDSISLSVDVNDIISAQEGIVIDELIQTKVEELRQEINDSIVQNLPVINNTNTTTAVVTTYSPFLQYFTYAIIMFLFLMGIIILNVKYSIFGKYKLWRKKKLAKKRAQKEAAIAKKVEEYQHQEDELDKQLVLSKKNLLLAKKELRSQEKKFKKAASNIQVQKKLTQRKIDAKQNQIASMQAQKKRIEQELGRMNSSLVAYQNESQSLDVKKAKQKTLVDEKSMQVEKSQKEIDALQVKRDKLDSNLDQLTHPKKK